MTDDLLVPDVGGQPEGGAGARRRRTGGREGHERNLLPPQRPWAQPRLRYRPTEVVSADELESIHVASLRVLEELGMDFLEPESRELLRAAGARVEPGSERVRFDRAMVEELIRTAPSSFTLHAPNPGHDLVIGGDWMAFGSVASAPNVYDADRGRRVGNRADYQDLIRLTQMLDVVHFFAGLSGGAGGHPCVRPPPPRDPRPRDARGQADPRLLARSPAQHRCARDDADPARRGRRDASTASHRSSPSSTRRRRSAWTRRCSRGSSSSAGATRSSS